MKICSASATVMLTFYDKKTEKSKQSIYAVFLMYSQIGTIFRIYNDDVHLDVYAF